MMNNMDREIREAREAGARALGWPIEFIDGYHNVARDNPTEFAARLASIVHTMQNTSD